MEKTFASSLRTRLAALLCAVAVALGMALPAGVAQAASVSSDSLKATITVQGASEGDQFKVWKILSPKLRKTLLRKGVLRRKQNSRRNGLRLQLR